MLFFGRLLLFILKSPDFKEFLFNSLDAYLTPVKVFTRSLKEDIDPLNAFQFFTSLPDASKRKLNNLFNQANITNIIKKGLQATPLSEIKKSFRSLSDYKNFIQGLTRLQQEQKVEQIIANSKGANSKLLNTIKDNFERATKQKPTQLDQIAEKQTNSEAAAELQANKIAKGRTDANRPDTQVNVFIDMVSSAIKGAMFVPVVQKQGTGEVYGIMLVIFKTNPHKVYNYYNASLFVFNKMVQAVGPTGDQNPNAPNGAWSVWLQYNGGPNYHKIGLKRAQKQRTNLFKRTNQYPKYTSI